MIKLAVLTSKGGTGKTTTAINLGHGLALSGQRVLIIDCDPQGSATTAFGVKSEKGLVDLMMEGRADIYKIRPELYLLPSGRKRLADLEIMMASRPDRYEILKKALHRLSGCDWAILDCSPSINIINFNALGFADYLLIPSSLDYFSLEGVRTTLEITDDVNNGGNGCVEILGVLPTFYDRRTVVARLALESLRSEYGNMIFKTEIRTNAQIKRSQWHRKTIFEYAPYSYGAFDYFNLAKEVLERVRGQKRHERY
jgi:chromosome partitioning protein